MKSRVARALVVAVIGLLGSALAAHAQAPATASPAGGPSTSPAGGSSAPPTETSAPPAQKDPRAAAPKPEPTGLERLSPDWPKWLKVGVQYRGRAESVRPLVGSSADYEGYYLNRVRLSVAASLGSWVQVVTQIQDAEAMGHSASPAPKSLAGGFDLRQGYIEVGRRGKRGALLAGGRSELSLGDGRLIASPDWGNNSRTYDMGRLSVFSPGVKVDVFRAAPVDANPSKFDRVKPGEYFWGGWATFDRVPGLSLVDVYVIDKATSVAAGEVRGAGDGRVYTYGARAATTVAKTVTLDAGAALQRGHQADDPVSAWAMHASVARSFTSWPTKPKLTLEYAFASGDANAKDARRGTFDQLYASNHAKYGLADLVGWRNMRTVAVKVDMSMTKRLKVNGALNRLYLATVSDAWYGSSGSKVVTNTRATSRDIGWEPDIFASYALSKELSFGGGVALLVPGGYVKQSTKLDRYWYPYATWALKF